MKREEMLKELEEQLSDGEMLEGLLEKSKPGSFACHEALHTACIVMDLVARQLMEHPSIVGNEEWFEKADKAHSALFDLYQAIGAARSDKEE